MSTGRLARELKYFDDQRDELMKHHEGSFALISVDRFLGAYTTEAEAYDAGLRAVGNKPFLIKLVARKDLVIEFPALAIGVVSATDI